MHWFTRIALVNKWITFLVIIAITLGSILATTRLKTELIPDIELPYVVVFGLAQGSSPEDTMEYLSKPVETEVQEIEGLKHLESTSAENMAFVFAEFEYGTDMAKAEEDIQAKLDEHPTLGTMAQAGDLIVSRITMEVIPLVWVTLSGHSGMATAELRTMAEQLVEETSDIEGILQEETPFMKAVEITGGQENVLVIPDHETMNTYSIPVSWLVSTLQSQAHYESIEAVQETPLLFNPAITLGDVSTIIEPLPDSYSDGKPAVSVIWRKDPEANTVDVANAIMEQTKEFQNNSTTAQIDISVVMDQSDYIEESISGLVRDAALGVILAGIVIYLFLWAFGASLIIIVSIPISIFVGFLMMYAFGVSINILTLGAMAIAVGRIVDNSIVSLENIYRHLQLGATFRDAAINGIKEVAMPITAATIATVAIFAPLMLVGGMIGELFRPFGFTLSFALIASLIVALMLVPPLASFMSRSKAKFEGSENWYTRAYTRTLRWSLTHRAITILIAIALFVASIFILPLVGTSFMDSGGEDTLAVEILMPYGNKAKVTEKIAQVEEKIRELDNEEGKVISYHSYMGNPTGAMGTDVGLATIMVELEPNTDKEQHAELLRNKCFSIEEANGTSIKVIAGSQQEEIMSSDRLEVRVIGTADGGLDSVQELTTILAEKIQAIEDSGDITNIESELVTELTNITITGLPEEYVMQWGWMRFGWPDIEKNGNSFYLQLATEEDEDVMEMGSYRFKMVPAPTTSLPHDVTAEISIPRIVNEVAGTDQDELLESVKNLTVMDLSGTPITLRDLVGDENIKWGAAEYLRFEGGYAGTIVAKVIADDIGAVTRDVQDIINATTLPDGVSEVKIGGVKEQMEEGFQDMGIAILLAIVIVFLIMAIAFRSWLTPMLIMLSLPLASIGAVLALLITGRPMGMSAMMGLLMLVGIVLTNAIVLLTFVEDRRKEGSCTHDALMDAGRIRLRPILMTALTTMVALVPLSLGASGGGIIAAELGVVVIGGLLSSTLLTLIVIPVLYSVTDRVRRDPHKDGRRRVAASQPVGSSDSTWSASSRSGDSGQSMWV